jgi:hypothetical protein
LRPWDNNDLTPNHWREGDEFVYTKCIRLALLLSFSLIFGASVSLAQEKMSMEDYNAQLAQWQGRENCSQTGTRTLVPKPAKK